MWALNELKQWTATSLDWSADNLSTLSPQCVMVTCLTHGNGIGGRGGEGGNLDTRGEGWWSKMPQRRGEGLKVVSHSQVGSKKPKFDLFH